MKGNVLIGLIVGVIIGWFVTTMVMKPKPTVIQTPQGAVTMTSNISPKQFQLYQNMRKLWEEHVTWTRLVVIGIVNNVPGTDQATTRLLKNYDDMANAIRPYYGDAAATKFAGLMKDHLTLAAKLVTEAKTGSKAVTQTEKDWYTNADNLAIFLSGANPNWPKAAVQAMLYEHLRMTKAEAVDRLQKNYAGDVATYDGIVNQALMMADTFSQGIIKQFPEKF